MSDYVPVGPKCPKCGHDQFDEVNRVEFNMTFVCCAECGTVVAYNDHLLAGKLDEIIEVLLDLKPEASPDGHR
jgi:uncharacterized Zn finger protein